MATSLDAVRRGLLTPSRLTELRALATAVAQWPPGSHVWGHYAERTAAGVAICRTENVSACVPGIAMLVDDALALVASDALGHDATAFKDKINYKQPGGAGFRPHQDRVAYPGVERVVSILVAIDPCTPESGCLWLAEGVDEVLPTDDRGVVRDDVSEALPWEPVPLDPGDAVLLDGLAPHFSEANDGETPRRVLVASYAPTSEGYTRERYYATRAEAMARASAGDGRFRISTLADFEGVEVGAATVARGRCTHAVLG